MRLTCAKKERFVYRKVASLVSEVIIMKQRYYYYYNEKNYHGKYIFKNKLIIKHIAEVYQSLIC